MTLCSWEKKMLIIWLNRMQLGWRWLLVLLLAPCLTFGSTQGCSCTKPGVSTIVPRLLHSSVWIQKVAETHVNYNAHVPIIRPSTFRKFASLRFICTQVLSRFFRKYLFLAYTLSCVKCLAGRGTPGQALANRQPRGRRNKASLSK